jgi:hypothetical protein
MTITEVHIGMVYISREIKLETALPWNLRVLNNPWNI